MVGQAPAKMAAREPDEEIEVFGRTVKVLKETNECGHVLLFRAQKTQTVNRPAPLQAVDTAEREDGLSLDDDLRCPICKELFTEPLTYKCRHTFCKTCIFQWKGVHPSKVTMCPLCNQKLAGQRKPSLALANMLEEHKKRAPCTEEEEEDTKSSQKRDRSGKEEEEEANEEEEEEEGDEDEEDNGGEGKSADDDAKCKHRKKRQKKEKNEVLVCTDYYLCGVLAREVTSPLICYTLRATKKRGANNLYEVSEILNFKKTFNKLTPSAIKRCLLLESEYFSGTKAFATKSVAQALQPLSATHGLGTADEITDEHHLRCLTPDARLRNVCRNLFRDRLYYMELSALGRSIDGILTPQERTALFAVEDEDGDGDEDEPYALVDRKITLFEKLVFGAHLSEERKQRVIEHAFEGLDLGQEDHSRLEDVWTASVLVHEERHAREAFGQVCLWPRRDDTRWSDGVLKVLASHPEHAEVRKDPHAGEHASSYLISAEIARAMHTVVRDLPKFKSLCCVRAEDDEDHDQPDGYFDHLRSLGRDSGKGGMLLVTTVARRKLYLKSNTRCTVQDVAEFLAQHKSAQGQPRHYSLVVVDRCHTIGFEKFSVVLQACLASAEGLVLCGSLLCEAEGCGTPFAEVYDVAPVLMPDFDSGRTIELSVEAPLRKIAAYHKFIGEMFVAGNNKGGRGAPMHVLVSKASERDKLCADFSAELGKKGGIVKCRKETCYSLKPQPTLCIVLQGSEMSRSHFVKCLSCSWVGNKPSVHVIGTAEDVHRVLQNDSFPRRAILGHFVH